MKWRKTKKPVNIAFYELLMRFYIVFVGMTRFELATPRPPDVCATGLRYVPKFPFFELGSTNWGQIEPFLINGLQI